MLPDWNGTPIAVERTRRGVLAVADVQDAFIDDGIWPSADIVQKLYASRHGGSFDDAARKTVSERLGYYCDLQSIHSEDVITWNFFGTIGADPAGVLRWITDQLGLPGDDTQCDVDLWRRIPHPENLASGGPEIDTTLIGDKTVVFIEAKWLSAEGTGQGQNRNKTQIQLRNEWFEQYGEAVLGHRIFVVLALTPFKNGISMSPTSELVTNGQLT